MLRSSELESAGTSEAARLARLALCGGIVGASLAGLLDAASLVQAGAAAVGFMAVIALKLMRLI